MKFMFIIILIWISLLSAKVNECVSDVYFANGINTDEDVAKKSRDIIAKKFKTFSPESYKSVANWKVSYNHTHGMGIDLYESMLQKIDEEFGIAMAWEVMDLFDYTFKGLVKKAALKLGKKTLGSFAKKQGEKIVEKIMSKYADKYGIVYIKGVPLNRGAIQYLVDEIFEIVIDECKTDVYFGNRILTEKKDARTNAGIFRDTIIEKFGLDYYNKHIGKVEETYNHTDGMLADLLESFVQKTNGTGIEYLNILRV